jgi:hypothetical protein
MSDVQEKIKSVKKQIEDLKEKIKKKRDEFNDTTCSYHLSYFHSPVGRRMPRGRDRRLAAAQMRRRRCPVRPCLFCGNTAMPLPCGHTMSRICAMAIFFGLGRPHLDKEGSATTKILFLFLRQLALFERNISHLTHMYNMLCLCTFSVFVFFFKKKRQPGRGAAGRLWVVKIVRK